MTSYSAYPSQKGISNLEFWLLLFKLHKWIIFTKSNKFHVIINYNSQTLLHIYYRSGPILWVLHDLAR